MSVSEKLTAVAANMQRVYEAGLANGSYDNGYADGQTAGYDSGHADGVQAGKQAEYDKFWDVFQANGTRTNYENAFYGNCWTDEIYKPKYIPKPRGNIIRMYCGARIPRIDLTNLDATEIIGGGVSAFDSTYIEYLAMDIPACATLASSLYYMRGLKTLKLYNMNQCLLGTLIQANVLETVEFSGTFGGEYMEMLQSSLLTYESLQNIIEAAYDYASNPDGKAHRVGLHATAKKKLAEADIAKLTQKGWTLT